MIAPYRTLTPTARRRTLDHEEDLFEAACAARLEGWHAHERDYVAAKARKLDVAVWPALANRLTRDARREVGSTA